MFRIICCSSTYTRWPSSDQILSAAARLEQQFSDAQVFDFSGELAVAVAHAPGGIARIIADVVRREIFADPVRARNQMALATDRPIDVEDIITIFETFIQGLRA